MIGDYFKLGFSNLRQRRLRSWLTMIGIFIGIAAVVALISLGQGMQEAITGQFTSLGADTITVTAAGGGFGPPGSYQAALIGTKDLEVVRKVLGVEAAFGRLIESVTVQVDGKPDYGYIVSLPQDSRELRYALTLPTSLEVIQGRALTSKDTCKLMIGYDLTQKDSLVRKLRLGDKIIVNERDFDIVGVIRKTGNPQLDKTLFAPEDCVREITDEPEKYGLIVAKVQSGENIDLVSERIAKELRRSRDVKLGKEDFSVESSQEVLDSLNSILGVVQAVLIGIACISLLVGGVGIMNTMYTAVLERTREIGIMKAIGGTNTSILSLFLIESGLLGLAGGIIGILLGVGMALAVELAAKQFWGTALIKAYISPELLLGAMIFSFLVGSLSGVMPARQAAKMHPVEALNHD